jgi:ParB family chromosome partitioning protein
MSETLQIVALDKIVESKTNPRRHFDERTIKELSESIKAKGLINPLLVRPQNGKFEIVAGARRFRASKLAELKELPVFVRQLSDEEALEIQVIENLQREDVHPLDEAIGYEQLMKKNKYDVDTIAAKVGKSASYVYQRLKLADLIEPARTAFFDEKITAGHAILIARLQPEDQKRTLEFALKTWQAFEGVHEYRNELNPDINEAPPAYGITERARTVCSVRDLTDFIQRRIHLDLRKAAFDKKDEKLLPRAGSCIACPKRSGFNKDLFNDITKSPDICTDHVCFAAKQQAHYEQLRATLKKEKKRFIEITEDDRKPEGHKGAITERSFKEISGKPCKHARIGIYIDGANKGHTITICAAKRECKQHFGELIKQATHRRSTPSEPRMSYEEEQQIREQKSQRAWKRFHPIAEQIWRKISDKLPKQLILVEILAELINEKIPSYLERCKPKGLKLSNAQIINLGLLCQQYEFDVSWEGSIHPDLYKAAKKLGIKFESILQKISDDEKASDKANKVQTSVKSKASKPAKAKKKKGGKK